ncbi:MAG TPA: AAA family ATPase [Ktedonobacterales bacterium]|jgi:tetratricopeptide (TPR) repeat protein/transcriptional regulator with XRE-family HTH domain
MMQSDDLDQLPFGSVLQYFRRAALQTQDDLARQVGYQPTLISMIERGQRFVKRESAEDFATALGLLPEERAALLAAHSRTAAARAVRKVVHVQAKPNAPGLATTLGPLIAREQEMKRLLAMLQHASHGAGPWVALAGEPGIGKTRLALEVAANAQSLGMRVALGHCYWEQQSSAYTPWMEMLKQVTRAIPDSLREAQHARWPLVLRLLPDIPREELSEAGDGMADQQVFFRQTAEFLRTVAEECPLVLLIDDLHWADEASLDLLKYLARYQHQVGQQLGVSRLFLISTCRHAEIARHATLRDVLHALEKEHLAERVLLSPLTEAQTTDLLNAYLPGGTIAPDASSLMYRIAEGVPFATVELLQGMRGRGNLALQDGTWQYVGAGEIDLPTNILEEIRERVRRLQSRAQDILRDASVLGEVFAPETVQRMGDRSLTEMEDALAEAEQDGLVRDAGREGYRFAHALVQRAIYVAIPTPHRRRLHRAAAEALAETSTRRGNAAELAWHFREGDDLAQAMTCSLAAGDDAEITYAHKDARQHYKMAESLARDLGDQEHEAIALEYLADVNYLLGLFQEANANLSRATAIYRAVRNWERLAWATCQMAKVCDMLDRIPESMRFTEALLDTLIAAQGADLADEAIYSDALAERAERAVSLLTERTATRVFLCLVARLVHLGRFDEVYALSLATAAHARRANDLRMESLNYAFRGTAQVHLGLVDEALATFDIALRTAEASGDYEAIYLALANSGALHEQRGDLRAARRMLLRTLDILRQLGDTMRTGSALHGLGVNAFMLGNWGEARARYEEAVAMAAQGDLSQSHLAQRSLLYLDLIEGRLPVAETLSKHDMAAAYQHEDVGFTLFSTNTLAELKIIAGFSGAVRESMRSTIADLDANDSLGCESLALLAWAEWESGHEDVAHDTLAAARQRADTLRSRLAYATIWRVEAIIALGEGRWEDGTRALDALLALTREMPYAEAKALYTYGLLHHQRGEPDMARAHYEQALAILNLLGERFYAERIERDLATE